MYKYINTSNGKIKYTPIHFEVGVKTINIEKSKENLFIFKKIMDKNNLKFGLIYGTLLGAIRENNFISHDEDTDVYIIDEDRQSFLDILSDLISNGFTIGRYEGDLISIIRNDEYIDIYIFYKYNFGYRRCNQAVIKEKYLINTIEYDFLNNFFNIPKDYENCLVELYGKNWKTPIKGYHSANYRMTAKIKQKIRKKFPYIYEWLRTILKRK